MPGGPQPLEHAQRMAIVQEITERLLTVHKEHVQTIALYGSTARGTDGLYSDIEIFCVLDTVEKKYAHEWIAGPWKAEVDVISESLLLEEAAQVEEDWALTHGCFFHPKALYDPNNLLNTLYHIVSSQPQEKFTAAIRGLIVYEIYEAIGKLRNAYYQSNRAYLPQAALNLARYGAYLLGLAHRYCYSTSSRVLEEALRLSDLPEGYTDLCHLVMNGDLGDADKILHIGNTFWSGVEQWAAVRGISFEGTERIPF